MEKATCDHTTTPTRRRALALLTVGTAAGTTVAAAASTVATTADPWLAMKAEHDRVEAERERLGAIWDQRMEGQPDDVGSGQASLTLDGSRRHITLTLDSLDGALEVEMRASPAWERRLRGVLVAELAHRQREIDETRARLGLDELDAQIERLVRDAEALAAPLRQTEPTTPAGLVAKLRWHAARADDHDYKTVAGEFASMAEAAGAIWSARAS